MNKPDSLIKPAEVLKEHFGVQNDQAHPQYKRKNAMNTPQTQPPASLGAATGSGFYRAYVEVLQGNRMMSDFISAAGLGLTCVGVRETMTIDYKPGEEVDAARVSKTMDSMIEASNREHTSFKILSYKVLGVTLIQNAIGEPAAGSPTH